MLFWFHFMHIQSIIKDLIFFSIPGVWDLPPYSLHKLSWKDQHSLSLSWDTRHWWKQRCSMYIFGNILLWIKTFFLYNSLDCSPCSCEIMITILHFTINKKRKNLLPPHLVFILTLMQNAMHNVPPPHVGVQTVTKKAWDLHLLV